MTLWIRRSLVFYNSPNVTSLLGLRQDYIATRYFHHWKLKICQHEWNNCSFQGFQANNSFIQSIVSQHGLQSYTPTCLMCCSQAHTRTQTKKRRFRLLLVRNLRHTQRPWHRGGQNGDDVMSLCLSTSPSGSEHG